MRVSRPRHLAIVGPTASGKSALALDLARALGDVEIVSLDSMLVYRGMDIGTAKPSPDERASIRHHLIDVADPSEEWSVVRTQRTARAAVADIEARSLRALLVGGSGLYVQAVVDDLEIPGEDLDVRARLEVETSGPGGVLAAYRRLEALDPAAARRIDEHNQRRIIRALEVIEVTGRPFSSFGSGVLGRGETVFPVQMLGVWLPRRELTRRIRARVHAMADRGLVEEARRLRELPLSRTAAQAIGYREIGAHLAGEIDGLDDALDLITRRTQSFARRQRMWFRRDRRIAWFGAAADPERLAAAMLAPCRSDAREEAA